MLHQLFRSTYAALLLCCLPVALAAQKKGIDYIDPTIGNVAPLLNTNRPIVQWPNQAVRVFPKRQDHLDMQITDFPAMVTNVITPQQVFGLKPSVGEVTDTGWYRRLNYDHDLETTTPWYYAVHLPDDKVFLEYTAGEKTGIYRFRFPANVQKNILFSHYYANGKYEIKGNAITGVEYVDDAIHAQKGLAFIYGELTGTFTSGKREGEKDFGRYNVGGTPEKPKKIAGERAFATYASTSQPVIEFRYGISLISVEQAKQHFLQELTNTSFDQLRNKCKAAWEKAIGKIKVEGGTESHRRTFYTALYRTYARMANFSENGRYFGYDSTVHLDNRPYYTDDYSWGNYLALHPLRCILDPAKEADMLQSYVRMYEQSGWMPEYPRPFGDRPGMFAFHSSVMFLDAYRKGIRNFDYQKAFEGNLKNAESATMLPFRNGPKGALEEFYYANGYYPALPPGAPETDPFAAQKKGQIRSSVAITLGDAYDSWALSEMAKELNRKEVAEKYAPRAKNYRNVWSDKYAMFIPKDDKGNFIDIDPKFDGGHNGFEYYNENNGWSYKWNVQQDIRGLSDLIGGPEKMEQALDQLFREDIGRSKSSFFHKFPNQTGMIGQFAMGNQVTFFIPYLFNYTPSPWKTQKYTRLIIDTWFQDNIFGVPGDEDGGSMSAFVVFSAMGFYPVTPGIPRYAITSPLFSKVTIDLPNGKKFTLIANGVSRQKKYIQSATMNGKKLHNLSFSHDELMAGGTLVLEMGENTNTNWTIQY